MSPNINSFVGDLVQMAQAMERLPQVEADLTALQRSYNDAQSTIQRREESILAYKAQIEQLNERVRSLEVERDDAGFRVLEVEDRMSTALRSFRLINDEVASAILLIDPPKPEPVAEPIAETVEAQTTDPHDLPNDGYGDRSSWPTYSPGQSEPLPTQLSGSVDTAPAWPTDTGSIASSTGAETTNNASPNTMTEPSPYTDASASDGPDTTPHRSLTEADLVPEPAPKGRFAGKKYWETVEYVNKEGWLKGGGALEDYRYGPERSIIEGNND